MSGTGPRAVYVHGCAVTAGWADPRLSLTDLIFKGVVAGLADAGMSMDQIDSVVLASHDMVDGRSLASMVTSPAAGAYMRDEIRLTDDGLNALSLAAARIEAHESEFAVVAAWGRASEGDYQAVSRKAYDPFLVQPFGLDEFSVSALRLSEWLAQHGPATEGRRSAFEARRSRALANPRSVPELSRATPLTFPLKDEDAPVLADIVAVTIVGATPGRARIAGVGHGTDQPTIGDRDLLAMTSLRQASLIAANAAGVALDGFDLYELDGATLTDEVLAMEALGLAVEGKGFEAFRTDKRVNPSGGGASMWSYPANGLVRLAEACLQMIGAAGPVQMSKRPQTAFVTGLSPVGAQTAVAVALESC